VAVLHPDHRTLARALHRAESSLGIAAACQLASLFDEADLDGNLLLADDPWQGVELVDQRQVPADEPGLGVRRRGAA
jgi:L-Ala-D/L-Glu epimerase